MMARASWLATAGCMQDSSGCCSPGVHICTYHEGMHFPADACQASEAGCCKQEQHVLLQG